MVQSHPSLGLDGHCQLGGQNPAPSSPPLWDLVRGLLAEWAAVFSAGWHLWGRGVPGVGCTQDAAGPLFSGTKPVTAAVAHVGCVPAVTA